MPTPVTGLDRTRMFWGEHTQWLFLLEVCLRTAVMFGWLVLMMGLIGKRGVGQVSMVELAFIMSMGSAAGDPMFYPDVPLLPALLCITVLVLLHRMMTWLVVRDEAVETLLEGVPHELIRDGRINLDGLQQARLSKEDLFEFLRVANIRQLGQVQRAYQEQNGQISLLHQPCGDSPLGLPIVPPWDLEAPERQSGEAACPDQPLACLDCGHCNHTAQTACPHCGGQDWTPACRDPLRPVTPESGNPVPSSGQSHSPDC